MALRTGATLRVLTLLILCIARNSLADGIGPVFPWPLPTDGSATIVGATVRRGPVSRALSFRAPGSRVDFAPVASLSDFQSFTWAAWVRPAVRGSIHPVMEYGLGSDVHVTLSLDESAVSSAHSVVAIVKTDGTSAVTISVSNAFRYSQWAHWAMTYDDMGDRRIRLYRDGVEIPYRTQSAATGAVVPDGDARFSLAASPGNQAYQFRGRLDDVRVYRGALSAAEIEALAHGGSGPTTTLGTSTTTSAPSTSTTSTSTTTTNTASSTTTTTTSGGTTTTTQPTGTDGHGPAILFADVDAGPTTGGPANAGVPISIFGRGFGAARGTSRVTIGGVEVARYLVWGSRNANNPGLDKIVIQPGAAIGTGNLVVTVNGVASNPTPFRAQSGTIRFVSTTGSDAAACTEAAPCATIAHVATDLMQPGDTLLVRGGTYTESEIWQRDEYGDSGTASARNLIKAFPGETVLMTNGARPWILGANYITVSGFHFRNDKGLVNGGETRGQRANWIIDNTFLGQVSYEATGAHGDDHLLAGNRCDATGSTQGTQGHCYYIAFGRNVRLLYNVGGGAPGYGIHVFDQRRGNINDPDFQRVIANLLIEGNILQSSTQRAGLIVAMGDEGHYGNHISGVTIRNNVFTGNDQLGVVINGIVADVHVLHNTFYQNGNAGLLLASSVQTTDVRGNLFVQSANTVCQIDCTWYPLSHLIAEGGIQGLTVRNNHYGPGTPILVGATDSAPTSGAVSFVDAAHGDFRLTAGSGGIDTVPALGGAPIDAAGVTRPIGTAADAGAYEFVTP